MEILFRFFTYDHALNPTYLESESNKLSITTLVINIIYQHTKNKIIGRRLYIYQQF